MTSETKTEHTPLPWETGLVPARGYGAIIVAAQRDTYMAVADLPETTLRAESAEANAALIVRAVNSHAALVEALTALKEQVRSYLLPRIPPGSADAPDAILWSIACEKTDAALRLAAATK